MDIRGTKLRIGGMFSYAFGADGKDSAAAAPEDVKKFLMDFQDTDRLKIMNGAQTGFLYIWRCGVGVGCGSGCERT